MKLSKILAEEGLTPKTAGTWQVRGGESVQCPRCEGTGRLQVGQTFTKEVEKGLMAQLQDGVLIVLDTRDISPDTGKTEGYLSKPDVFEYNEKVESPRDAEKIVARSLKKSRLMAHAFQGLYDWKRSRKKASLHSPKTAGDLHAEAIQDLLEDGYKEVPCTRGAMCKEQPAFLGRNKLMLLDLSGVEPRIFEYVGGWSGRGSGNAEGEGAKSARRWENRGCGSGRGWVGRRQS